MEGNPQKELNTTLEYLVELSNQDPEILKKKVYETFSGLSFLALEAKNANYKKGWASSIVDRHGQPLFGKKEALILETASNTIIKPMFENEKQKGGLSLKPSSTMSMIKTSGPPIIDPKDISLDKTYWKIKDFFESIDTRVHALSRELGPFRFFYDRQMDFRIPLPIPLAVPPYVTIIQIPIPPRSIPIVIGLIVETIRIIYSVGPLSNEKARKILSLVLGLIDLLKGDWKQGILSMIGFFGEAPLLAGLVGKVCINMLSLIAPDLQERLVFDLYQSGKSMCIGFFLWGFANFSPDFVRAIARAQFDAIKKIVDNANGQIDKVEDAMQKSVKAAGLTIKFKDIPEDFVPTFDDIQNLQAIARQPTIYCSKEFQEAIEPLRKIPPMRLILELMSIPTDPQSMEQDCHGEAGVSLEKTITEMATPEITPDPSSPLGQLLSKPEESKNNTKSEANEPEANQPEANEPHSNEPEANESEANEAQANEAQANEPHSNEPEANESEANEAQANEAQANEPEANKPEANKPEANSKNLKLKGKTKRNLSKTKPKANKPKANSKNLKLKGGTKRYRSRKHKTRRKSR